MYTLSPSSIYNQPLLTIYHIDIADASDVQAHNLEKQKHMEEYYKHTSTTSTTSSAGATTKGGEAAKAGANKADTPTAESEDENATVTDASKEESSAPWPKGGPIPGSPTGVQLRISSGSRTS